MLAVGAPVNRPTTRAISGLTRAGELEPRLAEGLGALDLEAERYGPGSVISATGAAPHMKWLLDGWACEARVLSTGQRQIFSFAIPGDVVQLPVATASRAVVALTAVECIDAAELLSQVDHRDDVLAAMLRAVALATARRYEHLSRLGRRSALVRLASLLVELHDRLDQVGLVHGREFALPLRHDELADALGLSPVHITRCLKTLRQRGLMTMKFRRVTGFERDGLEKLCSL